MAADGSYTAILAEDQDITRLGIKKMLERMENIVVVAEASSGSAAVRLAFEKSPSLVFMDIGLPEIDGIEATRLIKEALPAKVIMVTSRESESEIVAAFNAGADAYCLTDVSFPRLSSAITTVMEGAVWLDPFVARTLVKAAGRRLSEPAKPPRNRCHNPFQLSERERDVLALLVYGLSNQQMADKLHIGAETVKTHMRHLMEKMKVTDRTQAAVKAVKEGLIPGWYDG